MIVMIWLRYRFCIVTTSPQLIAKISWRYLCKGMSYRHHFDVVTMTMIFQKKLNFSTISILHHHDITTTYCKDIVTISSQWNVLSLSFQYCNYDDNFSKKKNFSTISILHHHDIAQMFIHKKIFNLLHKE